MPTATDNHAQHAAPPYRPSPRRLTLAEGELAYLRVHVANTGHLELALRTESNVRVAWVIPA
jgi:predicted secreted protein